MRFAALTTSTRLRVLVLLVVLGALATAMLAARTYHTGSLLNSAYQAGAPQASSVRPWMTIRYVATAYGVSEAVLLEHLGLPQQTHPDTTLKALAERADVSPPEYVRHVQRAIAAGASLPADPGSVEKTDSLTGPGDDVVSAILVYGYPALALTLLLGAIGVPLPSGLSMVIAGSLAAQGQMALGTLALVSTVSSVAGDVAGYGLGRTLGGSFLERRGRWFGLASDRRARVERLFDRWGALGVLLSRSLVSVLSSAVNLVAGAGGYRLGAFVAVGIVGRLLWTSAYLGLGYVGSGGLEPATDFLGSLTGLLVSIAVLAGLGVVLRRRSSVSGKTAEQPVSDEQSEARPPT